MIRVASLSRYPVKSLRGHALDLATVEPRGLAGDRRWMLVDDADRFVTRRQVPGMARLDVQMEGDRLVFAAPGLGSCEAGIPTEAAPQIDATVWRDTVAVRLGNPDADAFLRAALGRPVRLAYQADDSIRPVHPDWSSPGEHVSLADGFPLLVTTEASLAALNDRLPTAVAMERFRPNILIAGTDAWAEDRWRRIRIGTVTLRIARPCSRCIIVTQDPSTGERPHGNAPLSALRAMGHATAGGIMFGQNAVPETFGTIAPGDPVEILDEGDPNV